MAAISLISGGILVALVGVGCSIGAVVLFRGGADDWPDVIASAIVIRRVAIGLGVVSVALLITGTAVIVRCPGSVHAAAVAMLVFVAGGFWGNHAVFGDFRPVHTGSNVVIAAVALVLLLLGYPALVPVE